MMGTNAVSFMGYNAWLGGDKDISAVQVTEWEEPQAVIGSYLHQYAYPDFYQMHQTRGQQLQTAHSHHSGTANSVQLRGEYLFVAEGARGFVVYDAANIANKGFSQKLISAPVSRLGQNTRVVSSNATSIALPSIQPIAPERNQGELMRVTNQEQPFHPIYNYAAITDAKEGLILVDVNTLADGNPLNNFLTSLSFFTSLAFFTESSTYQGVPSALR